MIEKSDAWNPTCNRFVAFLDIMGFKDMVLRSRHKTVKDKLESFYSIIESIDQDFQNAQESQKTNLHTFVGKSTVKPVIFSDSIILVSSDGGISSAATIALTIWRIFLKALENALPIKGAIAFGRFTAPKDKPLYFGKPLIDAYELQKDLYLYGVVLHHTMEKQLNKLPGVFLKNSDLVSKYSVPMRSGIITHYVVNWMFLFRNSEEPIELVTKLYNSVSGNPRLYVDNTLKFVDEMNVRNVEIYRKRTTNKHI
jgi:hypothetical protein